MGSLIAYAEYDLPVEEAKALLELLAQYEVTWALS